MMMNENISERISVLVDQFGGGKNTVFAAKVGDNEANVRNYRSGKTTPKYSVLLSIVKNFDISAEWLLTGQGPMLSSAEAGSGVVSSAEAAGIPLLPAAALAHMGTMRQPPPAARYVVPCLGGATFVTEISGRDMLPTLAGGDVVACTPLSDHTFVQWGRMHIVVTRRQGVLCRRLRPSAAPDSVLAVADNPDFPPFDIPWSEIDALALVVGSIRIE